MEASQSLGSRAEAKALNETPALEDSCGWFGFIFMSYLDKLFSVGSKRTLTDTDLGGICEADRSDLLYEKFSVLYSNEATTKSLAQRSLWKILWRTVGYWKLYLSLFLFIISAALQFGPVMILTRLVRYLQKVETYDTESLWGMTVLLFVFPVVGAISLAHSNGIMAHLGAQFRNVLICAIYRKALKISPSKKLQISTGRIITMFSDDTNQIRQFLFFMTNSIVAPLQVAACLYLIYQQVGAATFVGLGYTLFTTPITGIVFGIVFKLRKQKMTHTDARVKLMNEILNGIRIIKYYAWENAFIRKICEIRVHEVGLVAKAGYIFNAAFGLLLLGATQIQTTLIFLTYIALGNQLDAAKAFTTLTLFGLMTSPFIFLPFGIQQYNQSRVSMKRIMDYLDSEDLVEYIQHAESSPSNDVAVELKGLSMAWSDAEEAWAEDNSALPKDEALSKSSNGKAYTAASSTDDAASPSPPCAIFPDGFHSNRAIHTLRDLDLVVRKGQLVAVVGSVGSGKSSLLSTLLGEMVLKSGKVVMFRNCDTGAPATIAYCDQRPWIVNATVEENITFGKPMDEERMKRAIFASCMQDDLKLLSAGLQTEIGERGINLSGGQKARVALARAVYNDADIYLLDDPISAVDAHVGMHLVEHCIKGALAGKTRFLVTHNLNILPSCDVIVILETDGTLKVSGTYEELLRSGVDLSQYLGKTNDIKSASATPEGEKAGPATKDAAANAEGDDDNPKNTTSTKGGEAAKEGGSSDGALTTVEERKEGNVTFSTYWCYVHFGGIVAFFLTIFFQLGSQVLGIEANFWLADWGKETTIGEWIHQSQTKCLLYSELCPP